MKAEITRELLQSYLDQGLSLDNIAALVSRDPSTVSYHLAKHGLRPVGHRKHAPSAKVDPDRVRELVANGASIHGIAEETGVSYSTARYWVRRLGLETRRMKRLRESRAARENGDTRTRATCEVHGETWFFKNPSGSFRCARCRSEAVSTLSPQGETEAG